MQALARNESSDIQIKRLFDSKGQDVVVVDCEVGREWKYKRKLT
jgi:hypothetical protein